MNTLACKEGERPTFIRQEGCSYVLSAKRGTFNVYPILQIGKMLKKKASHPKTGWGRSLLDLGLGLWFCPSLEEPCGKERDRGVPSP